MPESSKKEKDADQIQRSASSPWLAPDRKKNEVCSMQGL